MLQEIYIVDNDAKGVKELKRLFENEKEFIFRNVKTKNLEVALKNIPSLIIINEDTIDENIIDVCKKIRENEDNSITPIIVASSNMEKQHRIDILKLNIEYYLLKPVDEEYLYYTIKNIIRLIYTNRKVSPLTGLPGNVQIQAELKKHLLKKEDFTVLYFDLDNFKAYNDVYGFLRGDEIIKFTARTILNNIHQANCEEAFVGHIGGDDFVAIIQSKEYETICQNIINEFDTGILKYFTETDKERGYVECANRKGIIEQYPLTSISIGVVVADKNRFANILEIGEVGAAVKHVAKVSMGSTYAIDRRKN